MQDGQRSKLSLYSGNDKSTEKINIFIKKCKNLITQKPEGLTLYAKIDFNEVQIAESPKIQVTPENIPDINFSAVLNVVTTDQNNLDDITYKPIIITLIEVLPKEKKQKEEKVQPFGQCTFDLLDLIRGKTELSLKLPVYATPGSTLESQPADLSMPELEIKVMLEQPLLTEEELAKSNLLTITLDSMYAVPEPWLNNNREYAYTSSLPLPVNDEKDNAIVFVNGLLKAPTDPPAKHKRYVDTRGIQSASAVFLPALSHHEEQNVEELGDFQAKEDLEYRLTAEKEKHRIVWQAERRCFLNQTSNLAMRDQVLKARYWPIEIMRSSIPTGVKGKRDEDLNMSYHGVVYIDMQPLLYPGATHIRGAYKIYPFQDGEYATKTKRKNGIADEALKVVSSLYDRNFAVLPVKKDQKAAEKKDNKKARESNADGHDISQSVQQIIESKSFILIDIKFDKPLIPRKPFDLLVKKVSELIPPRPKYPLKTNSAEKAVADFHGQIKSILNNIIDDYRKLNLDENDSISETPSKSSRESEFEIKRKKLLFELNSTGKYFAFKEQLKNSVIKVVREKFLRTSALNDPDELQQFLSELYVFLIDELHKSLNESLSVEDVPATENHLTDSQQMKHFAIEAEMNRNYDLAAYYYQERIAREKDSYSNWYDYAVFNLLIEDLARCEECLKECISINAHEINGLLLYSAICAMQEKYDIAEIFLERVTAQENEHVVAWTLHSMLYEQKGQELNADITLKKVLKMNQIQYSELMASLNIQPQHAETEDEAAKKEEELIDESKLHAESKSRNSKRGTLTNPGKIKLNDPLIKSKSPGISHQKLEDLGPSLKEKQSMTELAINKSIYLRTADFLIKNNAFAWAEKCMAKELVSPNGGPSCQYHILLTKIKLAKNELEDAEKQCCEALAFDYQNYEAWILWGHIRYLTGEFRDAKERYERVLLFPELPSNQTHAIYIRLASIYLKEENYEEAKKLFLYPCKNSPSCMSWLGVGICCYRLELLEEAKNALAEANILNNKAPEVWAYLSLICLKTNKPLEAEQAYKYAIKLNLDNPELLDEIHLLQEQLGFGNPEF
ncbi:unnamed protein product [Brachionus calyciflorus]|uniref:Cilia-and flagella-associated protein 70 n=1 Tax=Brachionus calyciflorus TaxID=104777 RepID=A0A813VXT1_9BILA|nr:unnamed protein product [Brachionus calyciflorus]